MNIQVCRDTSDAVALYLPQRLYLKSFAKLNISVQLPTHKVHGKSISNWELMEKLRKMIQPDSFSLLKVSKHSSEVIRFDAELEHRDKLERVLARLEDRIVQLNDYPEALKVKVSEAKSDFPTRHSWDSFFRDATDMDEMKPGERPDTMHISNLPIRWFVHERDRDDEAPPSESILKKVFEKFGSVRQVDIPSADPFRMQMKAAMRGITIPPQDAALYFEGYIQFSEYVGFVRCMDALRGRKLVRKKDDIAEWCGIKVDFDKTKHMTDAAVKRRAIVRERLTARQRAKEEEERQEKERIAKREAKERQKYERTERDKLEKMREREERRKRKQLAKLMERDDVDLNSKVAEEKKKLLKSQKKLQALRLIEELFKRLELRPELQRNGLKPERYYQASERSARARIVDKMKRQQEEFVEVQRDKFKSALDGRIVIRSALDTKKSKRDSSISSISSDDGHKRVKLERLATPDRDMEYKKAAGMYSMPNPYSFGYPFAPVPPPGYHYAAQSGPLYYAARGALYPPPAPAPAPPPAPYEVRGRGRGRARGRGRGGGAGGPRLPYFEGPGAAHQYYRYFKKLTEAERNNEHDDRDRSRSRSRSRRRSRSRSRTRSRSRSRSHRRSYSRSRSRSRGRRSRSRSRRSRSRRSRSRSRRSHYSRSRSRNRSRTRSHSRSRSHRSKTKSRSKSKHRSPSPKAGRASVDSRKFISPSKMKEKVRDRSKSWSLPKEGEREKSWSKSPNVK